MGTELLYLADTYLFQAEAEIAVRQATEQGCAIALNQTIFYPQGGGQPSDTGTISTSNGLFNVANVKLDEHGVVWHLGVFESGSFQLGEIVELGVNEEKRKLHAKLHSAGHLVDCAVEKLGWDLQATKGFHFPEGAYVLYNGTIENPNEQIEIVSETIKELTSSDLIMEIKDLTPEEAIQMSIWAPPGKAARVVNFKGFSICGCGGTHVARSAELCNMTIRKIKCKKGQTRIGYDIG